MKASKRMQFPQNHDFSTFVPALEDYKELTISETDWLNYAIGDVKNVPGLAELFAEASERAKGRLPGLANLLPGMRGYKPLVEAISELVYSETRSEVNADNIVLSNGGCSGIWAAVMATCDPGDSVAYAVPAFPYWSILHLTGVTQEPLLFDRPPVYASTFADRIEELCKTRCPKAVIFNEPQNPMGYPLEEDQLKKLAELAERYDFWIIMDEVGRPFNFEAPEWWGKHFPPDRVIQVDSFTKRYAAPGLRLGWLICPDNIVKEVQSIFANIQGGISHASAEFGYQIMQVVSERENGSPVIKEIERRCVELQKIIDGLKPEVDIHYKQGIYALYYPSEDLADDEIREKLCTLKIKLMDNRFLYPEPEQGQRAYRFSIGGEHRIHNHVIEKFFKNHQ